MRVIKISALASLLAIMISACSAPGGGSLTCNMPCIDSEVTSSTSTVSTTTGGTVTISFHLNGDISEVSAVTAILSGTDVLNPVTPIGTGFSISPGSNDISMDISVNSGVATGEYYPHISVTSTATNTGSQYYIDPTKSTSNFTYNEVLNGASQTPQASSISIPKITVQ